MNIFPTLCPPPFVTLTLSCHLTLSPIPPVNIRHHQNYFLFTVTQPNSSGRADSLRSTRSLSTPQRQTVRGRQGSSIDTDGYPYPSSILDLNWHLYRV
ncbi:hypothetical protein CABS01_01579 [Colletotrichum abscissum]|uniref:uncharacterized protein n=1 Tax=Colletotrichum abscissum TaxID=1671311 RepID=UPI0027D69CCA|nr:uncharacterized protein CABS01_01579 [Colletotrichum abscissum]KAK1495772.1 hypothetical protein CABS01_01579 [Colletotrichum abscissum]